tara:strand:+ start:1324 stop:2475 length:1152 start_codon:yes stop_codon:yes gene_type:complete
MIRLNLFNSPSNTIITCVLFPLIIYVVFNGASWIFTEANWQAITNNKRLFLIGQYPQEESWRIQIVLIFLSYILGLLASLNKPVFYKISIGISSVILIIGLFPEQLMQIESPTRLWILSIGAGIPLGYFTRNRFHLNSSKIIVLGSIGMILSYILLRGLKNSEIIPYVSTNEWGGLLLTFFLALIGILLSFPLGIFLALGRRSNLPFFKGISVLFIETIRAVPLVTLLFMTLIIVPLLLPEGWRLDRVGRAVAAITIFSGAYMAENIRGGLASVPNGQIEAAKSLGLNTFMSLSLIVLPQALRNVIPAIVGQFISLFKDTSLVVTIGLLEIVGIGKSIVLGNIDYINTQAEVYLFLAFVFWIFTFSMSYISKLIENTLGVGKR